VDSTLVEYEGKWWLFANIIEPEGNSWDTLHLYFSHDPLSSNWIAHPQKSNYEGYTFGAAGGRHPNSREYLIRPSKIVRFGTVMPPTLIASPRWQKTSTQKTGGAFISLWKMGRILGVHTWNSSNGLVAIDAIFPKKTILFARIDFP